MNLMNKKWARLLVPMVWIWLGTAGWALGAEVQQEVVKGPVEIFCSNGFFVLFLVIGAGLLLGSVRVMGLSLGSSGVLFAALVAGHYGMSIPQGAGTFGLVLFTYCVGITAGSRFFSVIARQGSSLAKLSFCVVASGALVAYAVAWVLGLPADLAVGIFAGALTSTPALAAALDVIREPENMVAIGFGIAYPFGVVGVVLFVQLLPRLLKQDLDKLGRELDAKDESQPKVSTILVEVTNPNLVGRKIAETDLLESARCCVSRVLSKGRLVPLRWDDTFEVGQHVYVIGDESQLDLAVDFIGKKSQESGTIDADRERQQVVVTSKGMIGRRISDINPLKNFGVVITRLRRFDVAVVPHGDTVVENYDVLTVVGEHEDIMKFREAVGHRSDAVDETDILSLAFGIALGIVAGMIPLSLPGSSSITLGMAGGPLLVGLILGHFGRVGRIVGHMPKPSRTLIRELGLVLFLAAAGIKGGESMIATLQEYGLQVLLGGAVVTVAPMLLALPMATYLFRLNLLQSLGGVCGGMTSTPALGALTSKTDSQAPVVSYASAYPVALIFMTLFAQALIALIGR